MGYIGLLLNDPYKIDRMVGGCLIYFLDSCSLLCESHALAIGTNRRYAVKSLKMGVTRVLVILRCKP
jgi:hypothetical protein